jgi:hypothetical protein
LIHESDQAKSIKVLLKLLLGLVVQILLSVILDVFLGLELPAADTMGNFLADVPSSVDKYDSVDDSIHYLSATDLQ